MALPANCQAVAPNNPNFCVTCLSGFTNNNGVCQKVQTPNIPNCASYNLVTGICITCLGDFVLNNGTCNARGAGGSININNINTNINTNTNVNTNINTNVNTNVNTNTNINTNTNVNTGGSDGAGITNRDPNCIKYTNGVCTACSNRYYFSTSNQCIPINPLCKDYLPDGSCTSCYPGYQVSGKSCVISGRAQDPFCRSFNTGGVCTGCFTGYFYNQAAARCQPLNPLCRTSNIADGTCTACFPGYTLSQGNCQVAFQDPNCQKFEQSRCVQCSARFYLASDGKCKQINPLCRTADQTTGACLTCYPGYVVQTGQCILGGQATLDVNCQQFLNNTCVKCSNGFYLSSVNQACTQFNPLCKTSSTSNGACLSCYPGYTLSGGSCIIGNSNTGNGDPNCKETNNFGVCTECYSSYYLSPQATCLKLDPLCKTYTSARSECNSCYDGYSLYQGKCVISTQVPSANSDTYCIKVQGAQCL